MRTLEQWDRIEKKCAKHNAAEVIFIAAFAAFALGSLLTMLAIRFL